MGNLRALVFATSFFLPFISGALGAQDPPLVDDKTPRERIVEKWQGGLGENDYPLRRQVFLQSQKRLEFLSPEWVGYNFDGSRNFITLPDGGEKRVIDFVDEFEEDSYQYSDRILYSDLNVGGNSKGLNYFNFVYPTIEELSENLTLYDSLDDASRYAEENKEQGFKNLEKRMLAFALGEALYLEAAGIALSMVETKISFPSVKRLEGDKYYIIYEGTPDITFYFDSDRILFINYLNF